MGVITSVAASIVSGARRSSSGPSGCPGLACAGNHHCREGCDCAERRCSPDECSGFHGHSFPSGRPLRPGYDDDARGAVANGQPRGKRCARVLGSDGIEGRRRVEFRILGPLEVVGPTGVVSLGGRRQRALLCLLLIHRNHAGDSRSTGGRPVGRAAPGQRRENGAGVRVEAAKRPGRGTDRHARTLVSSSCRRR